MYWQQIQHYNLTFKEPGHMRTSESLVGPVESILHWSPGPVGWKGLRLHVILCFYLKVDYISSSKTAGCIACSEDVSYILTVQRKRQLC